NPVTRTRLDGTRFDVVPSGSSDMPVIDGLLNLSPTRFRLLQFDADGAGLKLMNFARSIGRRFDVNRRVDPITRYEEGMGAPSLRSAGLMLVQRGRARWLASRFDSNKDRNSDLEK